MFRTRIATAALALVLLASAASAQESAQATTRGGATRIVATQVGGTPSAADTKPADKPPVYDEAADAKLQIAEALARATRDNSRVLIQWGANWCGWCHLLHDLCASDKDLKHELLYEYEVVHVDIGRFDKHMDLAASYGADLKGTGVPYLTVLAADGSVLANQETGTLETKAPAPAPGTQPTQDPPPSHDRALVLAFFKQHEAPHVAADDLYRKALATASRDGKRVFLHFGAPWCGWCHKLENWMAQPSVAALLGRDFIDCKIDVDRTLGGNELLAAHRGSEGGGIPWFQFVSADGSVLADSNAEGSGNIGFPAAPGELAHFRAMLGKAAVNLTPADLDTLLASLAPAPPADATAPAAAPVLATPPGSAPTAPPGDGR